MDRDYLKYDKGTCDDPRFDAIIYQLDVCTILIMDSPAEKIFKAFTANEF